MQGHALERRIAAGEGGADGADALLGVRADCPAPRCHPHLFGFGGSGQLRVQRCRGCVLAFREQLVGAGQTGGGDLRSQAALRAGQSLLQSPGRSIPTDPAQGVSRRASQGLVRAREHRDQRFGRRAITACAQRGDHAQLQTRLPTSPGHPAASDRPSGRESFERTQGGVRDAAACW